MSRMTFELNGTLMGLGLCLITGQDPTFSVGLCLLVFGILSTVRSFYE